MGKLSRLKASKCEEAAIHRAKSSEIEEPRRPDFYLQREERERVDSRATQLLVNVAHLSSQLVNS